MFQQEGSGSIYGRKLALVLPISLEKNRSLCKKLKKADVWSGSKKQKRVEKLLTQLEQLLED